MIIHRTHVKTFTAVEDWVWEYTYEYFSTRQWLVFNRLHWSPLHRPPRPKIVEVAPSFRPSIITRQQWHIRRKLRCFTLEFAWNFDESRVWAYRLEMAKF